MQLQQLLSPLIISSLWNNSTNTNNNNSNSISNSNSNNKINNHLLITWLGLLNSFSNQKKKKLKYIYFSFSKHYFPLYLKKYIFITFFLFFSNRVMQIKPMSFVNNDDSDDSSEDG